MFQKIAKKVLKNCFTRKRVYVDAFFCSYYQIRMYEKNCLLKISQRVTNSLAPSIGLTTKQNYIT